MILKISYEKYTLQGADWDFFFFATVATVESGIEVCLVEFSRFSSLLFEKFFYSDEFSIPDSTVHRAFDQFIFLNF